MSEYNMPAGATSAQYETWCGQPRYSPATPSCHCCGTTTGALLPARDGYEPMCLRCEIDGLAAEVAAFDPASATFSDRAILATDLIYAQTFALGTVEFARVHALALGWHQTLKQAGEEAGHGVR